MEFLKPWIRSTAVLAVVFGVSLSLAGCAPPATGEANAAYCASSAAAQKEVLAADAAFDQAIMAIPGEATVPEAAATYQEAVKAWDAAVATIRSKVGCK
ncbi:MAG: hypothetical protein WCF12_08345 [Propionicimonas sp.]